MYVCVFVDIAFGITLRLESGQATAKQLAEAVASESSVDLGCSSACAGVKNKLPSFCFLCCFVAVLRHHDHRGGKETAD